MEYRLGREYIDRGSRTNPSDQFLRWINIDGSGMLNSPGIRPLRHLHPISDRGLPAFVVLITHFKSGNAASNPWDDVVDLSSAQIYYWGDSKFHPTKRLDDFHGNAELRRIFDVVLERGIGAAPPILHFSKPAKGVVRFNGLCVLEHLDLAWFFDKDRPVRNYRARLRILDCESVSTSWLHGRVRATSTKEVDAHSECPEVWRKISNGGRIVPLDITKRAIRSKNAQIPVSGSDDSRILKQLVALKPFDFERVVVALFQELSDVTHHIAGTRQTADGGFDFYGTFRLPRPLCYEIPFRGEVKRFAGSSAVSPKDVSRLVARLGRREYGIFVTTSYFTPQAQREVIADSYPIHLIAGCDLVDMMRQLGVTTRDGIRQDWLATVTDLSRAKGRD